MKETIEEDDWLRSKEVGTEDSLGLLCFHEIETFLDLVTLDDRRMVKSH